MRLVLDTCVVVAAVKSRMGASHVLVDLASRGKITAVLTGPLVAEYEDVLHRPENRVEGWSEDNLYALVDSLLVPSEWVTPDFSYRPLLTDEADEMVLEAAINGQADLVTFNVKHFRPAERFGVRIFKPGEVLRILQKGGLAYGAK